jgi:hypothetical protein
MSDSRERMAAYARHASWAIWSWPASTTRGQWAWVKDLDPLRRADSGALRADIVVIALNPATRGTIPADWAAFHDSANDGRLALALHGTGAEGAYMTDLVNDWNQSVSSTVSAVLAKDPRLAAHHVGRLHTELSDLGTSPKVLVCCGGVVYKHVRAHWPDCRDRISGITHYAFTRDNPGRPRFSQTDVYVADVRRALAAAGLKVPRPVVG